MAYRRSAARTLAALAALFVGLASGAAPGAAAPAPDARWLLLSDVHFDPFQNAMVTGQLAGAPAAAWESILSGSSLAPSGYFADTNYALLRSALSAMRAELPEPAVVVIAGDFLAHEFPEKFARAGPRKLQSEYEAFVDKTVAFLAAEFEAAFPHAQFVIALGNNDGYCGDYASTPESPFLARMARAWEPLVDRNGAAPAFIREFSHAGYYRTSLPAGTRASGEGLVLNSVFWSAKYNARCGSGAAAQDPGSNEIGWLQSAVREPAGAYRWYVTHIPPAIDDYSSLRAGRPVPFMREDEAGRLRDIVAGPSGGAAAFVLGHVHHASFGVIGPGDGSGVPALIVPSISPVQGSNPAFMTAAVDSASGVISDTVTYAYLLSTPNPAWTREAPFSTAFGPAPLDTANLDTLQAALRGDPVLRDAYAAYYNSQSPVAAIVPATWPWYWCGNVFLTSEAYAACLESNVPQATPAPAR